MSEVIEKESAELVTLPPAETALQVYQQPAGLDPYIEHIRAEVTGHVPDLSTDKGRKAIASLAFKVRKSKTALDALGKQLVDDLKEIPKKIDAERKRMRDALDTLADEVRRPLDEWEAAEEERTQAHKDALESIVLTVINSGETADQIRASLATIEQVEIGPQWQEFEAEAARAKDKALTNLRNALAAREKYEAEQAELTRLRAEAEARAKKDEEERIAREAAARATREAEAKAQAEREAAAKREADAKAAQAKAEQDAKDAVERQKHAEARAEAEKLAAEQRAKDAAEAARLAEIDRVAQEKAAAEADQSAVKLTEKHKAAVNGAAMEALVTGGIPADYAKKVIVMIARKEVPAVQIRY